MAEFEGNRNDDPEEPPDAKPAGPLLRDPPPPPGYINPVEESELLEEPFASDS